MRILSNCLLIILYYNACAKACAIALYWCFVHQNALFWVYLPYLAPILKVKNIYKKYKWYNRA